MADKNDFLNITQITPSILSADFIYLAKPLEELLYNDIKVLHLDIMDGHFVPNISFGPELASQINKAYPDFFLEAHLMITNPENYIKPFMDAGVKAFSVHAEIKPDIKRLKEIAGEGIPIGLAINPPTDIEVLNPYLDKADWFLVMSVMPGFGGQRFNTSALPKIKYLRGNAETRHKPIQVDGGINLSNIKMVQVEGASLFVVGSALLRAASITEYLLKLQSEIDISMFPLI